MVVVARGGWSSGLVSMTALEARSGGFQAATGGLWCLWSFRRLWVAVISRHSERQAALPRRWKRSARRLCLMYAKTGSIIA
jgi:hypothetical protein